MAAAFVVLAAGPASGATGSLDLSDAASVRLAGDLPRDNIGHAAGLRDFNGDGRDDIAIGGLFNGAENDLGSRGHEVFIHFGSPGSQVTTIRSTPGLHIKDSTGYLYGEVADAGDVNGDGLADVVLGGVRSAWVIFGAPGGGTLDLVSIGARGFPITGNQYERLLSVDGAGDVNGDGLADVVVGSRTADPHDRSDAGAAYVVYGKSTTDEVRTATLGDDGFEIDGAGPGDGVGVDVAGPGDVNGDGRSDILLSRAVTTLDPRDIDVVFTPADQSDVDLAEDYPGFAIGSIISPDVSAAGDVNGDGLADLLVGDVSADSPGICGRAFVVFGKPGVERIDLQSLGAAGLEIRPSDQTYNLGGYVAPAGDANGDGLSDVIVLSRDSPFLFAPCGVSDGGVDAGVAWVVFGRSAGGAIELGDLGANGFRIMSRSHSGGYGPVPLGFAVGDHNSDGLDDIGIAQAQSCKLDQGSIYIVPSPPSPADLPADPLNRSAEIWRGTPLRDQRRGTGFGDALFGEAGDDCLGGAEGADRVNGGDGDDELFGGLGSDVLAGDAGDDQLSPASLWEFDYPGAPDVLLGGPGDDVLGSEEFNQKGNSSFGEMGDDLFDGDEGNDVIDAGIGNDTATGGRGDDQVSGDSGNDRLAGNAGNDELIGEIGNDVLNGGVGDDSLRAGRNRDRLRGRGGLDEFVAGPGKDFVHSRDGVRELIRCGRGRDTVKADSLDRLIACEVAR